MLKYKNLYINITYKHRYRTYKFYMYYTIDNK
jgi:hypothetical protein